MRVPFGLMIAAAALAVSTGSAFALESSVTMSSTLSVDAMWKKIGDFCGISSWLAVGGITKCELSADGKQRTLTLKDGGTVVEALEKWDNANHSYSYTIVSGPLPVHNYHSTLSVGPDPKGSAVKWTGHYDAMGTTDEAAKATIDGIYTTGAKSLTGG
jgi:hypothetical protein